MIKKNSSISISLPEPCGEDWNAMTPNSCGRFCATCQKTVIDFTVMTDAEVLRIFRQSETIPCGRFLPEQLSRPLVVPQPPRQLPFYSKIAAAILALQAFTIHSFAQGKKKPTVTTQDKRTRQQAPQRAIKGRVVEGFGKPVPGLKLALTATGYDTLFTHTDEQGCFLFVLPDTYRPEMMQLKTTANYQGGIVDEDIALNEESLSTELTVYHIRPVILPAAEVTTTSYYRGSGSVGGAPVMHVYTKPTVWKKFKAHFKKHHK